MQVDEFWHQHILDSMVYIPFCSRIAGAYIHHSPHYEKPHSFHAPCFKYTKKVYLAKYKEEPNPEIWTAMGESGCGCDVGDVETGTGQTRAPSRTTYSVNHDTDTRSVLWCACLKDSISYIVFLLLGLGLVGGLTYAVVMFYSNY